MNENTQSFPLSGLDKALCFSIRSKVTVATVEMVSQKVELTNLMSV